MVAGFVQLREKQFHSCTDCGFEIGRLGHLNQDFVSFAKTSIPLKSVFMVLRFFRFLEALGAVLIFAALETGLKIYGFPVEGRTQSKCGGGAESRPILCR